MYNFLLTSADTDSIMICSPDSEYISKENRKILLNELNSLFPPTIHFEDDGYFSSVVILKAKNYATKDEDKKIKIKGSALKSSKTEKALKEFTDKILYLLLDDKKESDIQEIYQEYIKEIYNIKDISDGPVRKHLLIK